MIYIPPLEQTLVFPIFPFVDKEDFIMQKEINFAAGCLSFSRHFILGVEAPGLYVIKLCICHVFKTISC